MGMRGRLHRWIGDRIDPGFERIEGFVMKHPGSEKLITVALLAALPGWCAFAALLKEE